MARNGISFGSTLSRGLQRKCPCCGKGHAFRGYLKVVDACEVCDTPLSLYPTDDGPAYITMLLVGHLLVAPALMFGLVDRFPVTELALAMAGAMVVMTLILLPFIKGGFLSLLWYLGMKSAR